MMSEKDISPFLRSRKTLGSSRFVLQYSMSSSTDLRWASRSSEWTKNENCAPRHNICFEEGLVAQGKNGLPKLSLGSTYE